MTYRQLFEDAINKLDHGAITIGEYEKMIEPLDKEINQEHTQSEQKTCGGCMWEDSYSYGDCPNCSRAYREDLYQAQT